MELKHGYVLIAGIVFSVIVALLHIFLKKRKKSYKDGTKIYNMAFVKDHAYVKRRKSCKSFYPFLWCYPFLRALLQRLFWWRVRIKAR